MMLRLLTVLIISIFIFINRTVIFGLSFLLILILFSFVYRAELRSRIFKFIFFSSIFVFILQILFRTGNKILFQYGIITIYNEGIILGINVATVFLSMAFIIGILRTMDENVIFSYLEKHKLIEFLKIPLFSGYRFLPVLSYQAKIMNHYASIRSIRAKKGLFSRIKMYMDLLIPYFVAVFKRIFYMSLSAERRGIEKVQRVFPEAKNRIDFRDSIFFIVSLSAAILYLLFRRSVL